MNKLTLLLKGCSLLLLCLLTLPALAQQYIGLSTQYYSGTHRMYLNPTYAAAGPTRLSFNILSTGLTFHNNYARWNGKNSIFSSFGSDTDVFDYVEPKGNENNRVGFEAEFRGPAFMIGLGKLAGAGFSTRLRTDIQMKDTSLDLLELARLGLNDPYFQEDKVFKNQRFHFNTLAITELAVSGASRIPIPGLDAKLFAGLTIKRLHALYGNGLNIDRMNFTVSQVNGEPMLNIQSMEGSLYYSESNLGNFSANKLFGNSPGKGWGFDLGLSYQKKIFLGHELSLGVSLLDIGSIRFAGEDSKRYTFVRNQPITEEDFEQLEGDPVDAFKELFGLQETDAETAFSTQLPTALAVQADYRFTKKIAVSGMLHHQLQNSTSTVRTPNYAVVSPRFEIKQLGISLPFIFTQDYQQLAVGTALRLGPWFVGTDNLLSAFDRKNIDSYNVYTGFAFSLGSPL